MALIYLLLKCFSLQIEVGYANISIMDMGFL